MIKPLTSLRFFFAFLVMLSHYQIAGIPLFSEGYIGVSFFFILSGFVLTYAYKERMGEGSISKKDFYVARFARIYPLHLLTFLLALIIAFVISAPFTWDMMVLNLLLLQSWVPDPAYYFAFNGPSWSISDEAFFYLIFPFLLYFITRMYPRWRWVLFVSILVLYGAILVGCMHMGTTDDVVFYVNPLFRLVDFMIGMGLYFLWSHSSLSKQHSDIYTWKNTWLELGVLGLLVIAIWLSYDVPQILRYAIYYWLPMALVILVFARRNGGGYVSKLMSWKPLVIAGEVSFGFYMIHGLALQVGQPILNKVSGWLGLEFPEILRFAILFCAILGCSLLSFYYFETPVNKWIKSRFKA